jgi:Mn-dependent DtxR family transcriptional regulator
MIGVDEDIAENDACEIEHVVNPKTIEKMARYLKSVKTGTKS